jgi:hypothetical protein
MLIAMLMTHPTFNFAGAVELSSILGDTQKKLWKMAEGGGGRSGAWARGGYASGRGEGAWKRGGHGGGRGNGGRGGGRGRGGTVGGWGEGGGGAGGGDNATGEKTQVFVELFVPWADMSDVWARPEVRQRHIWSVQT